MAPAPLNKKSRNFLEKHVFSKVVWKTCLEIFQRAELPKGKYSHLCLWHHLAVNLPSEDWKRREANSCFRRSANHVMTALANWVKKCQKNLLMIEARETIDCVRNWACQTGPGQNIRVLPKLSKDIGVIAPAVLEPIEPSLSQLSLA